MENKQTAVKWLQHNMPDIYLIIPIRLALEFHAKFQQALQMEREQIEEAYMQGGDWEELPQPRFNNYYTQTFNK
jgi:hypothetical protein